MCQNFNNNLYSWLQQKNKCDIRDYLLEVKKFDKIVKENEQLVRKRKTRLSLARVDVNNIQLAGSSQSLIL